MGKIIVVTSGKGGVGKSTVAAYLGAALCAKDKRVLLIDTDEGLKSLDIMLGITQRAVFDLSDILSGNCNPNQAAVPVKQYQNLFLLPAPAKDNSIKSPEDMKKLCDIFSESFDYIIIDCPAGIGSNFINATSAADAALVVVNPDAVSVRDGGQVAQLLRENGLYDIRLVINKTNRKYMQKGIYHNIDQIIDLTSIQLIGAIPVDDEIVRANATGAALSKSKAREAFARIAARELGEELPLPKVKKYT